VVATELQLRRGGAGGACRLGRSRPWRWHLGGAINPRHPLIIASGAQTAQAASHGNFSLGLGLGAPSIEQKAFGISAANTVQRLREHLLVLRSIQQNGTVDFHGEELTAVDPGVMPVFVGVGWRHAISGVRRSDGTAGATGDRRTGRRHTV
jgi:alkanesulfonate monooxygenase SsuD/methylene tetrahydromethanopterin reductase-like flavin-dependent oxidoreductase (luciferase family)